MANEVAALVFGLMIGGAGGIGIHSTFATAETNTLRQQAIKAGVAHYEIVDPATGRSEFRFIPCEAR